MLLPALVAGLFVRGKMGSMKLLSRQVTGSQFDAFAALAIGLFIAAFGLVVYEGEMRLTVMFFAVANIMYAFQMWRKLRNKRDQN
jgi:hypothetical protein